RESRRARTAGSPPKDERLVPAAPVGAVEDVMADLIHPLHRPCPARADIGGMIVGRGAHLLQPYFPRRHCEPHLLSEAEMSGTGHAVLDAIAGKGELAAVAPILVLIDDAANRIGIGWV